MFFSIQCSLTIRQVFATTKTASELRGITLKN